MIRGSAGILCGTKKQRAGRSVSVRVFFIINLIIINKIIKKSRSLLRESDFFCNFAAEFEE